ncbi:MAG: hypothetical protein ABIO02_00110 [Patescibacteria group bacterium]
MSKTIIIGIIFLFIIGFGYIFFSNKDEKSRSLVSEKNFQQPSLTSAQNLPVDMQASFVIFTNGTFRVFTAPMYHNLSPDVYIAADNPNIIKVKKVNITWNDFFKTLPFKLTSECLTTGTKETFCTGTQGTLKFYLNGKRNNNALDQEIKMGDRLLVTYGNESDIAIKQQINKVP